MCMRNSLLLRLHWLPTVTTTFTTTHITHSPIPYINNADVNPILEWKNQPEKKSITFSSSIRNKVTTSKNKTTTTTTSENRSVINWWNKETQNLFDRTTLLQTSHFQFSFVCLCACFNEIGYQRTIKQKQTNKKWKRGEKWTKSTTLSYFRAQFGNGIRLSMKQIWRKNTVLQQQQIWIDY